MAKLRNKRSGDSSLQSKSSNQNTNGESRRVDSTGKNPNSSDILVAGGAYGSSPSRKALRAPAKKAIYNVVIAASLGVILFVVVLILAEIREQQQALIKQNETITEQTDINQKFFRCLVLIPIDKDRTPDERVRLVDKCAEQSKIPTASKERSKKQAKSQPPAVEPNRNSEIAKEAIISGRKNTRQKPPQYKKPPPSPPEEPAPEPTVLDALIARISGVMGGLLE